jgi:S1-C subfamily serine protease
VSTIDLRKLYDRYAGSVAYIAVMRKDGTQSMGSAFHIGEGLFITAKHVIDGNRILEIATTESTLEDINELDESKDIGRYLTHYAGKGSIVGIPFYHPDPNVDIAALRVDGIQAPSIPLGGHLDDWIGTELVLNDVLVLGYPPIPFVGGPMLFAAKAEINAVIDKRSGTHPEFIVSALARGGFSGGPVITDFGLVLGLVTESLSKNNEPAELGFMSVLSVEAIYSCLVHNKILPKKINEEWDGFWDS